MTAKRENSLKRNLHGETLFVIGLTAVIWGLLDSNLARTTIKVLAGFVLLVLGLSIIFSKSDIEASNHIRKTFDKLLTAIEGAFDRKNKIDED